MQKNSIANFLQASKYRLDVCNSINKNMIVFTHAKNYTLAKISLLRRSILPFASLSPFCHFRPTDRDGQTDIRTISCNSNCLFERCDFRSPKQHIHSHTPSASRRVDHYQGCQIRLICNNLPRDDLLISRNFW